MPKATKKKSDHFEASMEELNALVERMENNSLSLEESLVCFEKGIALTKKCQEVLSVAEAKVKVFMAEDSTTDDQN